MPVLPIHMRFRPKQGYIESYYLVTDIFEASDSSEQRDDNTDTPKFMTSYQLDGSALDEYQELSHIFRHGIKHDVYQPLWSHESTLDQEATAPTNTFYCDLTDRDFDIPDYIMLINGDVSEVLTVSSLGADHVITTANSVNTFPVGSLIIPCFLGTLKTVVPVNHKGVDEIGLINVEVEEY